MNCPSRNASRQEDLLDQGVGGPEGGERIAFHRSVVAIPDKDLLDLVQPVRAHARHDVRDPWILPHPQETNQARISERGIVLELDRLGRRLHGFSRFFSRESQVGRGVDVVNARFETRLHDSQVEPGEDEI